MTNRLRETRRAAHNHVRARALLMCPRSGDAYVEFLNLVRIGRSRYVPSLPVSTFRALSKAPEGTIVGSYRRDACLRGLENRETINEGKHDEWSPKLGQPVPGSLAKLSSNGRDRARRDEGPSRSSRNANYSSRYALLVISLGEGPFATLLGFGLIPRDGIPRARSSIILDTVRDE